MTSHSTRLLYPIPAEPAGFDNRQPLKQEGCHSNLTSHSIVLKRLIRIDITANTLGTVKIRKVVF